MGRDLRVPSRVLCSPTRTSLLDTLRSMFSSILAWFSGFTSPPTILAVYGDRRVVVRRSNAYVEMIEDLRFAIPEVAQILYEDTRLTTSDLPGLGDVEISELAWPDVMGSLTCITVSGKLKDIDPPQPLNPLGGTEPYVLVYTLKGGVITFASHTLAKTTIQTMKDRIESLLGTPSCEVFLEYEGQYLEGDHTLGDYGILPRSILNMVPDPLLGKKPIIYLFPPIDLPEVTVSISLVPSWSFLSLYPTTLPSPHALPNGEVGQIATWKVSAAPDGVLLDKATNTEVSYLFWEALTHLHRPISPEPSRPGTPVTHIRNDTFDPAHPSLSDHDSVLLSTANVASYLDHTLKALCLHTEARTSFITFWLPAFLGHEYIALRFLAQDAYEAAAPLHISPAPDVVTRVFMLFRGVKETELGLWNAARSRAEDEVSMWAGVVGVDATRGENSELFRVLEWGGMEVK